MPGKKVTYKEPAKYFNSDMRKAAEKWESEKAGKSTKPAVKKSKKK